MSIDFLACFFWVYSFRILIGFTSIGGTSKRKPKRDHIHNLESSRSRALYEVKEAIRVGQVGGRPEQGRGGREGDAVGDEGAPQVPHRRPAPVLGQRLEEPLREAPVRLSQRVGICESR